VKSSRWRGLWERSRSDVLRKVGSLIFCLGGVVQSSFKIWNGIVNARSDKELRQTPPPPPPQPKTPKNQGPPRPPPQTPTQKTPTHPKAGGILLGDSGTHPEKKERTSFKNPQGQGDHPLADGKRKVREKNCKGGRSKPGGGNLRL